MKNRLTDLNNHLFSQLERLTDEDMSAEKIEQDLMAIVPKRDWVQFSHRMILHGRRVCIARRPKCNECVLNDVCPSAFVSQG